MIYLTAIWLPPGDNSTVHIYTQTTHRTIQNKQYIEQHKNFGRVRAVPHLSELYPGICLTTEEKARKNLSQGKKTSVRVFTEQNLVLHFKDLTRNIFRSYKYKYIFFLLALQPIVGLYFATL